MFARRPLSHFLRAVKGREGRQRDMHITYHDHKGTDNISNKQTNRKRIKTIIG
jgi:hypothetical protein